MCKGVVRGTKVLVVDANSKEDEVKPRDTSSASCTYSTRPSQQS
jgi:hypothetical protein